MFSVGGNLALALLVIFRSTPHTIWLAASSSWQENLLLAGSTQDAVPLFSAQFIRFNLSDRSTWSLDKDTSVDEETFCDKELVSLSDLNYPYSLVCDLLFCSASDAEALKLICTAKFVLKLEAVAFIFRIYVPMSDLLFESTFS